MTNIHIIVVFTVALFCFMKFVENKYVEKQPMKPLKYFARDVVMVAVSTTVASIAYIYMNGTFSDFMNTITETKVIATGVSEVFTDDPGF